jgi:hypothetical protein
MEGLEPVNPNDRGVEELVLSGFFNSICSFRLVKNSLVLPSMKTPKMAQANNYKLFRHNSQFSTELNCW